MLKRIRIQHFRSCTDVTIDRMPQLMALIGRNGAGKTNVLRAVDWLARVATKAEYSVEFFHVFGFDKPPQRVEIEAEVNGRTYVYAIQRTQRRLSTKDAVRIDFTLKENLIERTTSGDQPILSRDGQKVTSLLRPGEVGLSPYTGSLVGLLSVLPSADPLAAAILPLFNFLSSVRYYPIDEPCDPSNPERQSWIREKVYQDWLAQYSETGNPGDSVPLRIIHMRLSQPERFKQLIELLGSQGVDLLKEIIVEKYPLSTGKPTEKSPNDLSVFTVFFMPMQSATMMQSAAAQPARAFDYSELSTGTRRMLKIRMALPTARVLRGGVCAG
jgi:hypothetical protein